MGGGVGGMVYSVRNDQIECSHSNHRGDVVARTATNGTINWLARYSAYGTRFDEVGATYDRQRGNTKDEEEPLGLNNQGMRWDDIVHGVWLTPDPIGFKDGPNRYSYVHCNPITQFDPLGLNAASYIAKKSVIEPARKNPEQYRANCERQTSEAQAEVQSSASWQFFHDPKPIGQFSYYSSISSIASNGDPNSGLTMGELNTEVALFAAALYADGVLAVRSSLTTSANAVRKGSEHIVKKGVANAPKTTAQFAEGSFSITEAGFKGYPKGVARPNGPFRLIDGAEYSAARKAANSANSSMRRSQGLVGKAVDIHEIQPVKFGGSATGAGNKVILDRALHRQQVTPWWNQLQRDLQ